jgi:hypothetical protein
LLILKKIKLLFRKRKNGRELGLNVSDPFSKIQIVKPLSKEAISKGNKGGGNWGARCGAKLNQIETIEE